MDIRPGTPAAYNVVSGWLGLEIPPMPRQRRRPYRKTDRQRSHVPSVRRGAWDDRRSPEEGGPQSSPAQTTLFSLTT